MYDTLSQVLVASFLIAYLVLLVLLMRWVFWSKSRSELRKRASLFEREQSRR